MKKIILLLLVIINTNVLFSQAISDSLLLYYPFSGNMLDSSGNGFHGQGNATLTTDRFGNINQAYSFNGTDQYIDLPNISELKPQLPVTFSFWLKLESLSASNAVFFTNDWQNNSHYGCFMTISTTGHPAVAYGSGTSISSSSRRTKQSTLLCTIGQWHHIIGVIKGPQDMDIYVDCKDFGGVYSGSGGPLRYSNTQGSLGRKDANNSSVASYYMWGSLDEFCCWNRALSPIEVGALCMGGPLTINDINNPKFEAFISPNPANNIIKIHTDKPEEIAFINIYNTIGQIVYNKEYSGNIDISNLNSGLYIIHIINNDNATLKTLKLNKI